MTESAGNNQSIRNARRLRINRITEWLPAQELSHLPGNIRLMQDLKRPNAH